MKDWKKFIREEAKQEVSEIHDPIELTKEEILTNKIAESFIHFDKEYIEPPTYLGILDTFTGKVSRVCTPGNISAITGKAKSKKSFLQTMFIASCAKNGVLQNKISSNLPMEKSQILVFDTEQSKYDVSRITNRVSNLIGYQPDTVGVFSLRGMAAAEIIELIEYALVLYKYTGMIFIDQVADLAKSINSEEEAVAIVRWLERLSKERDLHICCVIHQNKGDGHATGWLGSQIMKKAETVISVEKDENNKDVSHIKPSLTRSREFDEFSISINDVGIPMVLSEAEAKNYRNDSEF